MAKLRPGLARKRLFRQRLLLWSKQNKRQFPWRDEVDPYRILVAEKLLQQTSASHVMKVYELFFQRFPNLEALHRSTKQDIEEVIRPLGFWRIRARDLKLMASHLTSRQGVVPSNEEGLSSIPGVGRYVTTATLCFGFGAHHAIVDVNVRRVLKRLWYWRAELPRDLALERNLEEIIPANESRAFNWGILDFAAAICAKNPRCANCFAQDICDYYASKSDAGQPPTHAP